ncbi:hypothetical protein GA0115250_11131, partial [Streptomyces sp. BvitLS-983]
MTVLAPAPGRPGGGPGAATAARGVD